MKGKKLDPKAVITGYFANEKSSTVIHLVSAHNHKAICGTSVTSKKFQWCGQGIVWSYLECGHCKKIVQEYYDSLQPLVKASRVLVLTNVRQRYEQILLKTLAQEGYKDYITAGSGVTRTIVDAMILVAGADTGTSNKTAVKKEKVVKLNELQERIILYEGFIKDGKVKGCEEMYQKMIDKYRAILVLIETDRMTPEEFKKLQAPDRWDVAKILQNVSWCCQSCLDDFGPNLPERAWDSQHCCENCGAELTRRTGGGQGDPFNYTFVKLAKKKGIKKKKVVSSSH